MTWLVTLRWYIPWQPLLKRFKWLYLKNDRNVNVSFTACWKTDVWLGLLSDVPGRNMALASMGPISWADSSMTYYYYCTSPITSTTKTLHPQGPRPTGLTDRKKGGNGEMCTGLRTPKRPTFNSRPPGCWWLSSFCGYKREGTCAMLLPFVRIGMVHLSGRR